MAISTHTLLSLIQLLAEANSDYITFDTTTNITTNKSIISTTLNNYDDATDTIFNDWWVYITEGNNVGVERKTGSTTYATATGTLYVYGANLAAESAAVTCELFRYKRDFYKKAIIEACKEIYPTLHVGIDDQTLVTGNVLPDGHFESWSSSTALTYWTASNITLAQTSTVTYKRGGGYSAKCTAGAANGYIYVSSYTYPKLLELQGYTVDAYAWAYPETADDASIVIYTIQPDGTEQTLTSETAAPAGKWTELELESQSINDDLQEIQLRLKVKTNGQYVYFDDVYLGGIRLSEYLLPDNLLSGHVSKVLIQASGNSDEAFYDLRPFATNPGREVLFDIIDTGSYRYLKLRDFPCNQYRMRLIGNKPLETLSSDSDTITLDTEKLPLLIYKAQEIFYDRAAMPISASDISRFEYQKNSAKAKYLNLVNTHGMPRISERIK